MLFDTIINTNDKPPCVKCAPFVGKLYRSGEGPYPPFHIGCYCLRVPADSAESEDGMSETMYRIAPARGVERVDREARVIFGVSAAQAVEALGHGVILDETTLLQCVELGNGSKSGIKARFTHPGLSADGLGRFLGRLRDWRVDGDRVRADLHLSAAAFKSPDGNLGDYVLDLAEEDPEAFGMSMVFKGPAVWRRANGEEYDSEKYGRPDDATTEKPLVRVQVLRACDVVDEPAANRDGLFSSSARDTNVLAAEMFDYIDRTILDMGIAPVKAFDFALKYFQSRGVIVPEEDQVEEMLDVVVTDPAKQALDVEQAGKPDWAGYMAKQALVVALSGSGLPELNQEAVRRNLAGKQFTPEMVEEEIGFQRGMVASLAASPVRGMKPITERDVRGPGDDMQNAFDWLFGVEDATLPGPHLRSLRDIYQAITGDHDWQGVFRPEFSQFANATTSTLPGLAVNALNKVVQMHYDNMATYRWFENIVEVLPHDGSTHDVQLIHVDGVAVLPVVAEGDAYTEATVGDSKETMAFSKRGQFVGITIEMIRKSEIQRIRAIPKELVKASVRTRSGRISDIFTQTSGTGPVMVDDGLRLFHTTHANLATVAFTTAAFAAARTRIFKQVVPGTALASGLWPRFVLLPVDLYDAALEVFGYGAGDVGKPTAGGSAQTVNPYGESRRGDPRPIPVAVPEFTDTNDWAYITDPREHAPIKMAYANAPQGNRHPAPEVFQADSDSVGLMFTNDTLAVKIRDWFAFGVSTWVGVGKNNVA